MPEANKLAYYSTPADGSAAFNRYFYDNDIINYDKALTVNMAAQEASDQDNVVGMLNTIINESAAYYPSFSTISIDSKLDDAWKSKNMHIIAFVSRPMKEQEKDGKTALASAMNDLWVDNTNMVAVGESDLTDISNVINRNDVKEVGRYTIDGQKLNAPTKGINLVKLSNGQIIKVVVK